MSSFSRLLFAAAVVLAAASHSFADKNVVSRRGTNVVRSQSPVLHTGGADCGCAACAISRGGWRSKLGWPNKMGWLVDVFCLKKRWFRNLFPYNSCYKPVPPYLMENNGYNTSCWRRLPVMARPYPGMIEGFPDELQPLSLPAPDAADDATVTFGEEAETAPALFAPGKAPPLPDAANN